MSEPRSPSDPAERKSPSPASGSSSPTSSSSSSGRGTASVPALARPWRALIFAPSRAPLWSALFAVFCALAIAFIAILASGKNAAAGYADLFDGALGGMRPLGESALKGSVLILTGLSVAVAFTVGLFNIGAEGQLIWGALAAAVAGRLLPLPAPLAIPAALLCAALAGGLWGLLPAILKTARGVHEVISTILLNWVAIHLVHGWLVAGPLAVTTGSSDVSVAGTAPIRSEAFLPRLFPSTGSRADLGIVIALAIALLVWIFLTRTRRGFEWRCVGTGPDAARAQGISNARCIGEAMFLSGALAGLAGALIILGTEHRYPGVFRTGYGFDGIAVALVGGITAPGSVLAGLFFGALRAGSTRLQLDGIHPSFAELIQGLAVLFVAAPRIFFPLLAKLRGRAGELPPAEPPPGADPPRADSSKEISPAAPQTGEAAT